MSETINIEENLREYDLLIRNPYIDKEKLGIELIIKPAIKLGIIKKTYLKPKWRNKWRKLLK